MASPNGGTFLRQTMPRTIGGKKIKIGFPEPTQPSYTESTLSDDEVLGAYINEMYARYAPEELTLDEKNEGELRDSVAEWLRPGYDQAIANRKSQTLTNRAALDADAAARGMGASTYVTDVKSRLLGAEASDVASLEADYGAALAKAVAERQSEQSERLLDTQTYNAAQRKNAYDMAYAAAVKLFDSYKKSGGGRRKTSVAAKTSAENVEAFLNMLNKQERAEVYGASTKEGAQYRAEILASVGYQGYIQLQTEYPSIP